MKSIDIKISFNKCFEDIDTEEELLNFVPDIKTFEQKSNINIKEIHLKKKFKNDSSTKLF